MSDPKFKLYLSDGSASKTLTESHPKTTATDDDFKAAGTALAGIYSLNLDQVGLVTETKVYEAE